MKKFTRAVINRTLNFLFNLKVRVFYKPRKDIAIISQNCIGGLIYHRLGMRFSSPTINTIIKGNDFIKICKDPQHYFAINAVPYGLCQKEKSDVGYSYPLIRVGDIVVHCVHYKNCDEAVEAWNKRRKRTHGLSYFLIGNTWDLLNSASLIEDFLSIDVNNKVLFTNNDQFKCRDNVILYKSGIKNNSNGVPLVLPTEFTNSIKYIRFFEKTKPSIYKLIKKATI